MTSAIRWIPVGLLLAVGIGWAADRSVLIHPTLEPIPQSPPLGISVSGTVVDIHDGDTLTVEVRVPIRVRLRDCWAPELSEPQGLEARDRLKEVAEGKRCVIHVPLTDVRRPDQVLTFGRLLAHVWVDRCPRSLSQLMVDEGLATKEKHK